MHIYKEQNRRESKEKKGQYKFYVVNLTEASFSLLKISSKVSKGNNVRQKRRQLLQKDKKMKMIEMSYILGS